MSDERFHNIAEAERIFALQHTDANLQLAKERTVKQRIASIRKIERYLLDERNMAAWTEALRLDLGRDPEESKVIELLPFLVACKHVYDDLRDWVKDRPSGTPLAMAGLKGWTRFEPKGHVLIIAPWNYPLQLTLLPLIHAIAAGNVVLIKPSEISQHASGCIQRMIGELFEEREVAVVEGDVPTTTALLAKPWHHIFFTGSPAVGKIVMKAAAEHLTSVTLELGGKSPVIVHDSYDISKAARDIAWGKCLNTGQTCIAPDYALVPKHELEDFVVAFQAAVDHMYDGEGKGLKQAKQYGRMIDARNFKRVKDLIDDAVAKGAHIAMGGDLLDEEKFIPPHVLIDVTPDMDIMNEEIFGPVLPVLTYTELKDVPPLIARLERPLSLYIYSHDRKATAFLLKNTTAGTTAINELMTTTSNPMVPFGGVNHSGIGKSGGRHTFLEFSNERGIQKRTWGTLAPLKPPFRPFFIKWAIRLSRL